MTFRTHVANISATIMYIFVVGAWDTEMQADVPGEPSPAERLEVNECFGNKCQNGATCNFGDFGFNCDCLPGYEGTIDVAV